MTTHSTYLEVQLSLAVERIAELENELASVRAALKALQVKQNSEDIRLIFGPSPKPNWRLP